MAQPNQCRPVVPENAPKTGLRRDDCASLASRESGCSIVMAELISSPPYTIRDATGTATVEPLPNHHIQPGDWAYFAIRCSDKRCVKITLVPAWLETVSQLQLWEFRLMEEAIAIQEDVKPKIELRPRLMPAGDANGNADEGVDPESKMAVDVPTSSAQKEDQANDDVANISVEIGSELRSLSMDEAPANDEDEIADRIKNGSELKRRTAEQPTMSRMQTRATRKRVDSARQETLDPECKRQKLKEKERMAEEKRVEKERKEKEREEKKREKEKEKEEKKREEEERKRKKDEEREAKRREDEEQRKEKKREEEERRRRKEEERDAKRREDQEQRKKKEERKRMEDEEKQLKKRQEEERKAAKRREEEAARLLEEEKKCRASTKFLSFFKPVEKRLESPLKKQDAAHWFMPYEVRKNAALAPMLRREPLPEKWQLSDYETDEAGTYLQEMKRKYSSRTPSAAATADDFPQIVGERIEKMKYFRLVPATSTRLQKSKLYHFHLSYRPPFYGTSTQPMPKGLNGRRPMGKAEILDYEVESDEEWEEDPADAEECRSDEEDEVEDEEDDDDEGFFVEPRYLSDGEGESEDDACAVPGEGEDVRAARMAARAQDWQQGVERKRQLLVSTIIGPSYNKPPAPCTSLKAIIF
ncbi:unnamed protein product, partial [Mesorhabditis spiculigera]